ncbi:MAG: Dihydropteroate synthase [Magnetococcales bacterium]|nr:Dihydropteroate synthase [Magnetococcales bacterium]HIJ82630.1 dihydropteroate synthase [Magnetococcales bacterium]
MTVQAILEPVVCFPGPFPVETRYTSAHSSPGLLGGEACPKWHVGLEPWQGGEEELPSGLYAVEGSHGQRRVQGQVTQADLGHWIQSLEHQGFRAQAQALGIALQGHRVSPPVMCWGSGRRFRLDFSRPRIMGILNLTPDSFSGDGMRGRVADAVARGVEMERQGADVVDVGGESTRPGATEVSVEEELDRVVAVVAALAQRLEIPVSVDTCKPQVMEASLEAGAGMINDVSALGAADGDENGPVDRRKVALLADGTCPIVLMHRQGKPQEMQKNPHYRDCVWDIYRFLDRRIQELQGFGIDKKRLIADVGFGFGKSVGHNLELMRRQGAFRGLGVPLLFGISRKRVVGALCGEENPGLRDVGSHMLAVFGMLTGAQMFRVHDVAGARQALAAAWGWMNDGEHLGTGYE